MVLVTLVILLSLPLALESDPYCPDASLTNIRLDTDFDEVSRIEWWFTDINGTATQLSNLPLFRQYEYTPQRVNILTRSIQSPSNQRDPSKTNHSAPVSRDPGHAKLELEPISNPKMGFWPNSSCSTVPRICNHVAQTVMKVCELWL